MLRCLSCLASLVLLLTQATPAIGQRPPQPIRILLLGNSLYWGLTPESWFIGTSAIDGFCRAAGLPCQVHRQFEFFGQPPEGRIDPFIENQVRDPRIVNLLQRGRFDYVVVATRATGFWEDSTTRTAMDGFRSMYEMVTAAGGKLVMSSAYSTRPDLSRAPRVAEGHDRVRIQLDSIAQSRGWERPILAPTGPLYSAAVERFGLARWYADDYHGSALAQYATGVLFFTYITGRDPRDLDFRELPTNIERVRKTRPDVASSEEWGWVTDQVWTLYTNRGRPSETRP